MRSPYVAYLSPLDSFFAVASERFWSGSPFSDSLELFKYIPSASLNPEKLRSGEAGRASTPSGELLYPLRTGLSHTGVYGRFSLGSSGGGSSENRQMLLAGVAYLPHPQIPHQAIQIIRMHAEQPGRGGVIVLRLLKRLRDSIAFGAIDGVLQRRSPDHIGGPGNLADALGQVFQLNDVARAEHHRALQSVLQFADVARPVVVHKVRLSFW